MEEYGNIKDDLLELSEEKIDQITEILLNTQEQCQMMEHLIENQIKVKDEMIDKLHKELEFYKQEYSNRFVDQLMKAVIKVRKDMKKQMSPEKWQELNVEDLKREYVYVFEDLTDLLEQQNIDEYTTAQGEAFDAAIHQAKIEHTDDICQDKTVKQSISEGYTKGDKVLIPERVIVYQSKEEQ